MAQWVPFGRETHDVQPLIPRAIRRLLADKLDFSDETATRARRVHVIYLYTIYNINIPDKTPPREYTSIPDDATRRDDVPFPTTQPLVGVCL